MNCAVAHCGGKSVYFLCLPLFVPLVRGSLDNARDDGTRSVVFYKEVRPFQEILRFALNDRTLLEMMFFEDRHFDQVKRVEKSPKAKQWLSNTLNLPYFPPMDSLSHILTFPYFLKAIRQFIFSHSNSLVYLTQYIYPLYFNLSLL